MGCIRLILAIAVVASHSGGILYLPLLPGSTAVQTFYVISGFYMALILNEKYADKKNCYQLFISNRLLRLLPVYWAALLIGVAATILTHGYFAQEMPTTPIALYSPMSIGTLLFAVWSNLFILGQDLSMFLGIDSISGSLYPTTNFHAAALPAHRLLVVPQGWSLSIEMLFYAIAPAIATRRSSVLFLILMASVATRILLYSAGYSFDPWAHRFFPNELALFVWGALAYRWYVWIRRYPPSNLRLCEVFALSLTLLLGFPYFFREWPELRLWGFLLLFGACIPYVFLLSKTWVVDRVLGELSYPVYLIHVSIIWLVVTFIGISNHTVAATVIPITLIISFLVYYFVARPIDAVRQKRIESGGDDHLPQNRSSAI